MNKGILGRILGQVVPRKITNSELVRRESQVGSQLFGELPPGHEREFFCLDEHTWVWHESWRDEDGKPKSVTTRYEIHQDRIVKIQDGQPNSLLDEQETSRLLEAAQWYYHLVGKQIYALAS